MIRALLCHSNCQTPVLHQINSLKIISTKNRKLVFFSTKKLSRTVFYAILCLINPLIPVQRGRQGVDDHEAGFDCLLVYF